MLVYIQKTDPGRIRENNEDAMAILDPEDPKRGTLFLIADGLGGMPRGELASDKAIAEMERIFNAQNEFVDASFLRDWIQEVNTKLYNVNKYFAPDERMATTLTTSLFYKNKLMIAHVGDTRLYQLRQGKWKQLTTDHATGRNELTRAVGLFHTVDIDLYQLDVEVGDIYLQCTDGFYTMVSQREIVETLLYHELPAACEKLIQRANENGGLDNITVQLVTVERDP